MGCASPADRPPENGGKALFKLVTATSVSLSVVDALISHTCGSINKLLIGRAMHASVRELKGSERAQVPAAPRGASQKASGDEAAESGAVSGSQRSATPSGNQTADQYQQVGGTVTENNQILQSTENSSQNTP